MWIASALYHIRFKAGRQVGIAESLTQNNIDRNFMSRCVIK